jgi:uncharacterized membrane protein YcaP (DUF421 family)
MHISWLFLTLSTITTFAILLMMVRWIGSTQLTQLTFFNWVAGASMGNVAANMLSTTDMKIWISNCYSLVVFTAASIVAANLALKSRGFRGVTTGEPIVLVHKGVILRENLRKTKVNLDVLMMLLREKGYFSYNDIEFAILEPTGNLSILPTPASQSVSKVDLVKGPDLSEKGQGPYVEIVVDGEIDEDKLKSTGHTREWLLDRIRDLGADGLEDVTYLAINEQGEIISDFNRQKAPSKEDPTV